METKQCSKCPAVLPVTDFHVRCVKPDGTVIRFAHCKACRNAYNNAWQKTSKGRITTARYQRQRARETKAWVLAQLKVNKCSRCDESHPACLDLHHPDPHAKHFSFAAIKGNRNKLLEEARGCIVLCSNCHRKEHWLNDDDFRHDVLSTT